MTGEFQGSLHNYRDMEGGCAEVVEGPMAVTRCQYFSFDAVVWHMADIPYASSRRKHDTMLG